ncbi:MAG: HNH endonuclease [Candidatus Moranbacteria bacterium]|nr:HNH endonuclease [Candidatus Moranbacteria bacterium]
MSITEKTKKILFAESGNRCAFPECRQVLVLNGEGNEHSIVGEMAHIKGEKPTAARYDESMTQIERDAPENLVVLCNIHHKVIDDQEKNYPVEMLLEIKNNHRNWVLKNIQKEIPNISFAELEVLTKFLMENSSNESNFELINISEKIQKNELSSEVENLIKMGLSRANLVKEYIKSSIDVNFGERLRDRFVEKYKELKSENNLSGDSLFYELFDFSCGGSSDFNIKAAGLVILVYFFEACDIFEK